MRRCAGPERSAAGEYANPRGTLMITAPIVFGRLRVVPVVADFLDLHPAIDVRLLLGDRIVNLLEDHIDLALRIGDLPDSALVATQVGMIRRVVCASPAYLTQWSEPATPEALAAHRCVTFEGLMAASAWTFPAERGPQAVAVRSRLCVNAADAAIAAAIAGLGLTRVLGAFEPAPMPVSLVHAGQGRLPMKCRAFIDFAAKALRTRLGDEAGARGKHRPDASSI